MTNDLVHEQSLLIPLRIQILFGIAVRKGVNAIEAIMARLTRAQSRADTRDRLLAEARSQFALNGYAATSMERIAEAAGFSKGAIYSNFDSKEAIFRSVLRSQGDEALDAVIAAIGGATNASEIVDALAAWGDSCSRSGSWSLTILEYGRAAGLDAAYAQQEILRNHWRRLGNALLTKYPGIANHAESLGALLHEIAFAPAMTLVETPTAGDLMRLALGGLMRDAPAPG